ncbi:hypothetical protein EK21DRAFT_76931 [Setomelanomma holmii]|uniref:Uncharacterized protein n=1 Tax=Setomelanomma holmii TaxID=210430 RepID=A0A9P4H076_9PLEO|nr:hypothetical protein EK21DRAFT_76931 [Setomelanomma holmii]
MLIEARWDEWRQKMQAVKEMYMSRHYTQCIKFGERLLAEVKIEIHPLHLAYLNFYMALSHDTLAREATLKNRFKELSLAEKHYTAAIAALSPSRTPQPNNDEPSSPVSTASEEETIWKFRRSSNAGSMDSTNSSTSSATLYSADMDYTPKGLGRYAFPQPPREFGENLTSPTLLSRHNPIITITPERPQTPEEYQFAADTAAFVGMVRGHLANVLDMKRKTSVPSVRFNFPTPRASPAMSKPRSDHLFDDDSDALEVVRRNRRSLRFRPRFDPSSVQQLCNEALAELH